MTELQKLEKQVGELKATIKLIKAKEAKPKKFKFKYPEECYLLYVTQVENGGGQKSSFIEHGRYRITKEVVEQSLARNKRANRLEALAEQLGGLKEWKYGESNYYICYSGRTTMWSSTFASGCFYPESVYMTEECAVEICRILNNGEFEV